MVWIVKTWKGGMFVLPWKQHWQTLPTLPCNVSYWRVADPYDWGADW